MTPLVCGFLCNPCRRRRRAQPPARYGQWETGTPAGEPDTPGQRTGASSPEASSPSEPNAADGTGSLHWEPALHSKEAARVQEMARQAMTALLEAVPEEKATKPAAHEPSLQDRLKQTWQGHSYYDRLAEIAGADGSGTAAEEEDAEGGDKVGSVTDMLLKMGKCPALPTPKQVKLEHYMHTIYMPINSYCKDYVNTPVDYIGSGNVYLYYLYIVFPKYITFPTYLFEYIATHTYGNISTSCCYRKTQLAQTHSYKGYLKD